MKHQNMIKYGVLDIMIKMLLILINKNMVEIYQVKLLWKLEMDYNKIYDYLIIIYIIRYLNRIINKHIINLLIYSLIIIQI